MANFQRSTKLEDIPGVRINEPPFDRTVKLLASPLIARNSINFAMGVSIIEPGKQHEVHTHDAEETIFVLSGYGEIMVNGSERLSLEKDTVVVLRSGEPHGINNLGNEPLRCLWVYSPSGPESKFASGANAPLNHSKKE